MSNSIKLSPKYGVNPTIPICFWCGKEKGSLALMGHLGDGRKHEDFEAPKYMVLNYEPCPECRKNMEMGFTVMEATAFPNEVTSRAIQTDVYPTGRYVVIKPEAAERIFTDVARQETTKAFLDRDAFAGMFEKFV